MIVPTTENTCAVIVTYFPDKDIFLRLQAVHKQLPSIILVDNGSDDNCLSLLRDFVGFTTIELRENNENLGLAKALNIGLGLATTRGFKWVLMLDQDTSIYDDMFNRLVKTYELSGGISPLIGSNYWNVSKGESFLKCNNPSKGFVHRRTVITSGTLMKLSLFKQIGEFRDDYFIDSIDHDYCLRVRKAGLEVLMSCEILMSHTIGSVDGGHRWLAFDHSPVRKYYIVRNTLVTVKQYFWREPTWCLRQLVRLMVEFASIVFFEGDKRKKIMAYFKGALDAVKNRMGPLA